MRLLGKSRRLDRDRRWRVDCDYLNRLPVAEREYLEAFLLDYYWSSAMTSPRGSASRRDIVTASISAVTDACASAPDGNLRKRGSYQPSDYEQPDFCPEDAMIEAIDNSRRTT